MARGTGLMLRTAVFPGRYLQGPRALSFFGEETARLGRRPVIFIDRNVPVNVIEMIGRDLVETVVRQVEPTCTLAAIDAAVDVAREVGADVVAGMGGGKVIDLGRAAADNLSLSYVAIPTVAASDAPCSSLAVIYDENGKVLNDRFVRSNPRLVIVDSNVIAGAPPRFFASGIGDALATYYEALACHRSGATNMCGGRATEMAMAISKLCRDIVVSKGADAMAECRSGRPGSAFESVLEANILLSGIGFESGGVAAAHAIHHGLAECYETHHALHGEKVAFGVLVELALNNATDSEIFEIAKFNISVGLPVTLGELGISDIATALPIIVKRATRAGEIIFNEPIEITPERVADAIRRAEQIGQTLRAQ